MHHTYTHTHTQIYMYKQTLQVVALTHALLLANGEDRYRTLPLFPLTFTPSLPTLGHSALMSRTHTHACLHEYAHTVMTAMMMTRMMMTMARMMMRVMVVRVVMVRGTSQEIPSHAVSV
jgi:hypothetical protein